MILTDLPYGITACSWDTIIPFEPMWVQFKRVIKRNGAIVLTASQPFTSKLVMSNLENYKHCWYYEKANITGFLDAKKRPLKVIEEVLVFAQEQGWVYNPQNVIVSGKPIKKVKQKGDVYGEYTGNYIQQFTNYPTNILKFSYDTDKYHPTQKPVNLFRYLIRTYTNEGETVLDCTAGSGTTGVACIIEKRKYILIEQEQKYIDVIHKRLELEHSKLTLF